MPAVEIYLHETEDTRAPVSIAERTGQRTEQRTSYDPLPPASVDDSPSESIDGNTYVGQESRLDFANNPALFLSPHLPSFERDPNTTTSEREPNRPAPPPRASPTTEWNTTWDRNYVRQDRPFSLADRMSRMWSPQAEAHYNDAYTATFPKISDEDWLWLSGQLSEVYVPRHPSNVRYELPSRSALSRYLYRFLNEFHPHYPIVHSQTLSIRDMAPELTLAMATVGCQYCLESREAKRMFDLTRDVILEKVDRRQIGYDSAQLGWAPPVQASEDQVPGDRFSFLSQNHRLQLGACQECHAYALIETMQALFYLMVVASWGEVNQGRSRDIATIQSLLALLMQQQGLSERACSLCSWESWIRHESARRTKLAIFCIFGLRAISTNVPSATLLADIRLQLPCQAAEWQALNAESWEMIHRESERPLMFHDHFELLFQSDGDVPSCSTLGSHIMIHAILQHIFYLHQVTQVNDLRGQGSVEQLLSVQRALKRWRSSCEQDTESSLDPLVQSGPIVSNSVALYRLAYIRLLVNIGPARSLIEQDETIIIGRLKSLPPLSRNPLLTMAARQAMAALLAPLEQGIFLIGQERNWSVVHAICSLEYAYILTEFLRLTAAHELTSPLDSDEHDVLVGIKEVLLEVEKCLPNGNLAGFHNAPKFLAGKVALAWATILQSARTWKIVDLVRRVLLQLAESTDIGG
ncbi:hypothetical protein N7447_009356 [Penicillium robsamsonii]|uniref:uncharacterized protein n=1 Tax=Penicillium robsamsonii TaxID=1792511 RepID=UPI002547413A|nr:uncharacterized protein N7447_009356 [Penicillium robsamsonii]KAJ5817123.1 hypothetical protein N7447_009356 [Penicillium robsamsonii]